MARQTSLKSFVDAQASSSSSTRSTSEASTSGSVIMAPVEDSESESNSGDSDMAIMSPSLHCPVKRKRKVDKRTFNSDWKLKYMMWPVKSSPEGTAEGGATKSDET